jgi:CHAT domain-containing protein/tetratricopeptide (TPR) repeat protein
MIAVSNELKNWNSMRSLFLSFVTGNALVLFTSILSISESSVAIAIVPSQVNMAQTTVQGTVKSPQQVLDEFNQSLLLYRQTGNKTEEAKILSNIAIFYLNLGEYERALDYYDQSLSLYQQLKETAKVATIINNIGKIYSDLGEKQKALNYYNQYLLLNQQLRDIAGEAIALNNIGQVYSDLGKKQEVLDYFHQSLRLKRQVGNKAGEAITLNNIGQLYSELGEYQKALDYLNQALLIKQQVGEKPQEATTLSNIGKVYSKLQEPQKALDYYYQALPLYRQVGKRANEARTLYNIALVQREQNNLDAALTQIETVINIVENQRTKITSQELRSAYFAAVQDYYQFYIDLLMQLDKQQPSQGYAALALQTSERARARILLELLTEANTDIRQGVEPKLLSQERNFQQQLDTLEKRRIQLLGSNHTEAQIQALEQEIEAVLEQYQQLQTKIRATSPRYAALTQPQPLSLEQIQQQVLDDNTLLLEYSLGEQRSYLWAVTNKSITSYELPKRADIEAAVQKFRQAITTPYLINSPSIDALSQLILAPVAQELGKKRLVIVGDGALQYVPFAALNTPAAQVSKSYEPLLLNHEIVTLPSASTLGILRREYKKRKFAPKKLIVLADPIFRSNDERLQISRPAVRQSNLESLTLARAATDSGINFERLRFTRREAEQILALIPANKRQQAFDFNASRATATSQELSQYQIIHFATHGILNSKHPELSGIVLSLFDSQGRPQNGFLRLHDVFNLNLKAELVVLSACKTGLGEEVKGEGLVGLTRGFMYAGSPRVVVSLWSVDDEATSELMQVFYKKMLQAGLKPAAALRAAQIEIWRSQRYAAPYYWAAFTLQGDWN